VTQLHRLPAGERAWWMDAEATGGHAVRVPIQPPPNCLFLIR